MLKKKISEADVLRWFDQGIDTAKIAYLLRVSESDIANLLGRARDAKYHSDHASISPECEPAMENQEIRGDVSF